uniref:Hydrolase_4 domain-containing protein n=1 Tax=Parastrongyloides trichosuri TaxID=131310 RepID=A0A0N4ZFQ1_PARTI
MTERTHNKNPRTRKKRKKTNQQSKNGKKVSYATLSNTSTTIDGNKKDYLEKTQGTQCELNRILEQQSKELGGSNKKVTDKEAGSPILEKKDVFVKVENEGTTNQKEGVMEEFPNAIIVHGNLNDIDKIEDNKLYVYYENIEFKNNNTRINVTNTDPTKEDRFKLYYECPPIKPVRMLGRQLNFFKAMLGLKNQKYSIDCSCKNTSNQLVKKIEKKSRGVYNNTRNIYKVLFKKNQGKTFSERCAFWPGRPEYFYYQTDEMYGKTYKEQIENHLIFTKGYGISSEEINLKMNPKNLKITNKITQANSDCINQGNFLFGYNHPCFFFTDPVEFFFLNTPEEHTIACCYVELKREPKYTIIYSHPNAMDLSDSVCGFPNLSDLARFLEVNFITYDYSGYGISNGKPTEEVLKSNLRTVINHVMNDRFVPIDRIVLFGYSIGGALSAMVAAEYSSLAGLILFGAPASLSAIVKYQLFKSNIKADNNVCGDVFNTVKAISNVYAPTLIVQSKVDKMVPHSNGYAIYCHAKNPVPPYLLDDIKHNYMDTSAFALLKVKEFIQYTLKQEPIK